MTHIPTLSTPPEVSPRFEIVSGHAAIETHRAAWEGCVAATGADIYFTPDWLLAWLRAHGRSGQFRVLLAWQGDRLAGLLPFLVETLLAGPVPVRVARLAGTDPSYAVMGLALPFETDPDLAAATLAAALADLTGLARCHAVSLSPLSECMPGIAAIRVAAVAAGLGIAAEDWSRQHTVMRLPDSFEAWLDSLSKSRRREYRKDLGKLAERGALATRATTPETALDRLDTFAALHTDQWREIGKAGHFGDWPEALPFAREAVARLAASGRAGIDEHWCGGTLLSAQYGFRQGSRAYWRLIGRTLDPELVQLGVGRVGLVERVRDLIAAGVRTIEAGAGEYDYKLNYGGELVPMGRLVLASPGAGWRARLLLGVADLLDLAYYRIWFLKLAPRLRSRLGFAARPLWRAWRRTRL